MRCSSAIGYSISRNGGFGTSETALRSTKGHAARLGQEDRRASKAAATVLLGMSLRRDDDRRLAHVMRRIRPPRAEGLRFLQPGERAIIEGDLRKALEDVVRKACGDLIDAVRRLLRPAAFDAPRIGHGWDENKLAHPGRDCGQRPP